MKHVIRYLLDGDGTVPKFVDDGGYFIIGYEMVGISVDDEKRYLPLSVHKLTRVDLYARVDSMEMYGSDRNLLTSEEKHAIVDNFLTQRGLSNY